VRRGTRFRYTLSEPAQVTIFFQRVLFSPRIKGRKRHRIYQPVGLITRRHPIAGPVSVAFSGRIVASNGLIKTLDTRLAPGRYRATLGAVDFSPSQNKSKLVRLAFTVVR
jgi:hypothetical protein